MIFQTKSYDFLQTNIEHDDFVSSRDIGFVHGSQKWSQVILEIQ